MSKILYLKKINDYLWHGYLPPSHIPEWMWRDLPEPPSDIAYTPAYASNLFDQLFDQLCAERTGPHLVTISGGWDSRLILCALRERLTASEIIAVSYGCPGQLDYDIGADVAAALGVKHIPIDLSRHSMEWDRLVASCNYSPWTNVPNGYYELLVQETGFRHGATNVWLGFLGGALTGGAHLSRNGTRNDETSSALAFASKERVSPFVSLSDDSYAPEYPSVLSDNWSNIPLLERLYLAIRQVGLMGPLFLPQSHWIGWHAEQGRNQFGSTIIAPFAEAEWASYWLNCPRELHHGQKLYLAMARTKFPDLFALPSKYTFGAKPGNRIDYYRRRYSHSMRVRLKHRFPRMGIAPKLTHNYINFDEAFRVREDYKSILDSALSFLKQEEVVPWIDLDGIVSEHRNRKAHHGRALLVLVGLAANLCAEKRHEDQSVRQTI